MKIKAHEVKVTAEFILYGISIANAFRLAWAFTYADAGGNILSVPGVFGMLIGAMVSLGVAYVAGKIPGTMTDTRRRLAWIILLTVLVMETFILAPLTLTDIPDNLRLTLGDYAPLWSAVLALVPSLVMAGVAFAGGNLVADAKKERAEPAPAVVVPAVEPEEPKEKEKNVSCRHGCKHAPMTQDGENAHSRWCPRNPARLSTNVEKV